MFGVVVMGPGHGGFVPRAKKGNQWPIVLATCLILVGVLLFALEGDVGPSLATFILFLVIAIVGWQLYKNFALGRQYKRLTVFGRRYLGNANTLVILRDIGLKINAAFEEKTLAIITCRSTKELLDADIALLFTFDTEENHLGLRGAEGVSETFLEQIGKRGSTLALHAIEKMQVLVTSDFISSDWPGLEEFDSQGIQSLLCIPLRVGPLKIGVLIAGRKTEESFSDEQVHTILLLSEQIAMAVRNVQLYERSRKQRNLLQDRVAMLAWLHEATRSLNESLNTSEVLDRILRFVSKACGVEKVILAVQNEEGEWIPNRACGIGLEEIRTATAKSEDAFIQKLLSGQPVMVNDLETAPGPSVRFHETLSLLHIRSYLALPLVHEGKVMGFISVLSPEPQHFSEEQLNILAILSYQAAVALQNAYLYETANRNKAMAEDSARYLKGIIDNLSEGLVVYDGENKPQVINPAFYKMFGAGSFNASGAKELSTEDDNLGERYLLATASEKIGRKDDLVFSGSNSKTEEIELSNPRAVIQRITSPLHDERGNTKGRVVVYHDITDEREGQRARDEFMATVSHELRTPLTAIIGYTDILLKGIFGKVEDKQLSYLEKVKFSSRRLLSLINDVLDVSKIQSGRLVLRRDWVDLMQVVERSMNSAAVMAEAKGVSLEWIRSPHELQAWVDRDRLQQVLDNLLGNAIKFTPDGGRVTLRVRRMEYDRSVRVSVTDTGVGIAPEHLARIFDRFYQVDSSSRREYSGTGLGLSIARSLVEIHGGTIRVKSRLEKGSVFSFVIPIRPEG